MTTNYDELADRAERGELKIKPGTVRRGPEAADAAQRLLIDAALEIIGDQDDSAEAAVTAGRRTASEQDS